MKVILTILQWTIDLRKEIRNQYSLNSYRDMAANKIKTIEQGAFRHLNQLLNL